MSFSWYLILMGVLFAIGAVTVLVRRSATISLMGVELMLSSVNFAFMTSARIFDDVNGETMAFFVMAIVAAEVVVGLAITVSVFKSRSTTGVDDANLLKS